MDKSFNQLVMFQRPYDEYNQVPAWNGWIHQWNWGLEAAAHLHWTDNDWGLHLLEIEAGSCKDWVVSVAWDYGVNIGSRGASAICRGFLPLSTPFTHSLVATLQLSEHSQRNVVVLLRVWSHQSIWSPFHDCSVRRNQRGIYFLHLCPFA